VASKIQRVEWTMPYGEDGDDLDLELYVGVRGGDLEEWIEKLPDAADMTEMMRKLLIFIVITCSQQK
jgi:hypothetical protein